MPLPAAPVATSLLEQQQNPVCTPGDDKYANEALIPLLYLPPHLGLDEAFVHVLTQQLTESLTVLALLALLLLLQLLPDLRLLLVQIPVTQQVTKL